MLDQIRNEMIESLIKINELSEELQTRIKTDPNILEKCNYSKDVAELNKAFSEFTWICGSLWTAKLCINSFEKSMVKGVKK